MAKKAAEKSLTADQLEKIKKLEKKFKSKVSKIEKDFYDKIVAIKKASDAKEAARIKQKVINS